MASEEKSTKGRGEQEHAPAGREAEQPKEGRLPEEMQAGAERAKDAAQRTVSRAEELEHKAQEKVEETGRKVVDALRHRRGLGAIAAGGAAFALASAIGAAEVAVAAAGAYAAYRWLGENTKRRPPSPEPAAHQH